MNRRHFLQNTAAAFTAGVWPFSLAQAMPGREPRYRLALGQWTFNRAFRGVDGATRRDPLEFPTMAGELGFEGVDYSGILLGEHHANPKSLAELNRRAADAGVKNVLILIDLHDALGAKDAAVRQANAERFRPWLDV